MVKAVPPPIIKSVKLKRGLKNDAVKCKAKKTPKHPKHLFPAHTLMIPVGNVGSGKTNATTLLIQEYFDYGTYNELYIISPTFEYNASLQTLKPKPENVYTNAREGLAAIEDISKKTKILAKEYFDEVKYKLSYKRWKEGNPTFDDEYVLAVQQHRKPIKHLQWPSPCLIIDDMSHSNIYSSGHNAFSNLVLRHRHLHHIGISIFMLVQTFTTGAPKALRQNTRQFLIWKTHDQTQLKVMYDSLASRVTFDVFMAVYKKAIEGSNHNFLTIDMTAPDDNKVFRRNFDEFLLVENLIKNRV